MTTTTSTEPALLFVSILNVDPFTFGVSLQAGAYQWNADESLTLNEAAEVAGMTLYHQGHPLSIGIVMPEELPRNASMEVAQSIMASLKRGYDKAADRDDD